ncbi:Olfactory receptor 8I2 [Heterocephalus glaber]|uniref:Olfactory receptor 8I2 n=1 Tax=Heterocephalus glaber TaxID=10181 RepID=G5B4K6_HETGA|nr:Olfactory receptor 8I2 [Heterocephalus glaber]
MEPVIFVLAWFTILSFLLIIMATCLIFTHLQPDNTSSLTQAQMACLFYTIVIPMLNPLIYSLKNREVKYALLRILNRKQFM